MALKTLWTQRQAWLLAIRPKTLGAAIAPVMIGTALAAGDGAFHLNAALAALLGAVLIQIGTNFANDYYDFQKGADTAERLGPQRVTQSGLLPPAAVKQLFLIVFGLAALCGVYLVARAGFPIVVIGLLSVACGIGYTGGPYPLAYNGLGDIFVLIFFGPVAAGGTYFVQALEWSSLALAAGLVPGLTATALIAVNNLRDAPTDAKVDKKTLAVRFGEDFVRFEIQFALLLSGTLPLLLVLADPDHWPALICLATWKPMLEIIRSIRLGTTGRGLNLVLAQTGKLLLLQALLFSGGWLLGALF
jgi:1,4-dihydroxy-2-naphthoate octaprenyltransferase